MGVRAQNCTREYLGTIPLPNHADTYTVISHEFVISNTLEQLALHGFTIADEKYRANSDGSIAQGIYYLNYTKDPEVGMMFAWCNSYNKQMRFKCAIGGYVFICMNGVVAGDMASYTRRHTGTADSDTVKTIVDQISNADSYFDEIVKDKETMKKITLTERKQAELLGILYAEYEIITSEQLSVIKHQMDKPSYDYNCEVNSLWAFYNHVTYALKKSHPKDWMDDQRKLHLFIAMEFDLLNYDTEESEDVEFNIVDPLELNYGEPENQTNLLLQIAEVTGDDSLINVKPLDVLDDDFIVSLEEEFEVEAEPTWIEDEVILYEDPAGNTFEVPVLEEPKESLVSHKIKTLDFTDTVYEAAAVVDDVTIDGEPDDEYLARVTFIEEEPKVEPEKLSLDDILIRIPNAEKKVLEEALEVEEVKPTENKVVDDFDFNFDDEPQNDLGGEFFL